ncbi:MAG: alpha/beta hydrolase [Pseudomonadota bacterium]
MLIRLFVLAVLLVFTKVAQAESSFQQKEWEGTLQSSIPLPLLLKIETDGHALSGHLEAPSQAPDQPIAISGLHRNTSRLSFSVPSLLVSYEGEWDDRTQCWKGQWTQAAETNDLTFCARPTLLERRPQTPVAPFPYHVEDVTFESRTEPFKLSGTLTYQLSSDTVPYVILLSGSGPQDRDERIFEHKPFAVLADQLTRRGIGVLRYDDRGVGQSEGTFSEASVFDFAEDAAGAVSYLRSREDLNVESIGLIGHSEGGLVAPVAAASSAEIDHIILLAGPAEPLEETLLYQLRQVLPRAHLSDEKRASEDQRILDLYRSVSRYDSAGDAKVFLEDALTPGMLAIMGNSPAAKPEMIEALSSKWMRDGLRLESDALWGPIGIPVLALFGEVDQQVPAQSNADSLAKALDHNSALTIQILPQLNHLFQTADTGAVSEYATIRETMSPQIWDLIDQHIKDLERNK